MTVGRHLFVQNLYSSEKEQTKCSSTITKKKRKRGQPKSKPVPGHTNICLNCFSTIAEGSNHTAVKCKNSKKTKVEKLVNISSPSTLQHAASRDRKTSDCPVTPLDQPKKKKKEEEVKKDLFSSADCPGMQQDLGLSNSKTKILLRDIRLATESQKGIEKNDFMMMQQNNHQLDTFFELSKLGHRLKEKETKIIKNLEYPTKVCSNLP